MIYYGSVRHGSLDLQKQHRHCHLKILLLNTKQSEGNIPVLAKLIRWLPLH